MKTTNTTSMKLPMKTNRNQVSFIAQMTSLGLLGAIIILGNLASIITLIKSKSLRRRSFYLITCLAAADLLVGMVVFMVLYYFLTGLNINAYAFAMDFLDTLGGLLSILILSAISVELFSAILFPLRHRRLSFKVYVAMSAFLLILATGLSVMNLIGHSKRLIYYSFMHVSFIVVTLALLTISVAYISVGCKMSRPHDVNRQNQIRTLRDKKLVITLLIVTLSSLITWMPMQGFVFIKNVCKKCPLPDFNDIFIMKFFQYCNSGLNIFIYMVRMTDFRVAFLALFCRRNQRTLRRPNILQKPNPAFSDEEEAGAGGRAMGQANGLVDFKADVDHGTFILPTNGTDEPRISTSNQHNVATKDSNESETPDISLHNYNTSSKYETAEDTTM